MYVCTYINPNFLVMFINTANNNLITKFFK